MNSLACDGDEVFFFVCLFLLLIFFLLPRSTPFALHSTDGRVDEQIEALELVALFRWRRGRCHVIVGRELQVSRVAAIARAVGGFHVDGRPRIAGTSW